MNKVSERGGIQPSMPTAFCLVAAALGAAMHIGKLPPAVPVLEKVLGITLLQAGFLLSLVQFAGMCFGLMTGVAVQRLGLKRSMVGGLLVLGTASLLGSFSENVGWLLVTRAFEGLGFLWVVLPGPGLLRLLVPGDRINRMMGVWGTYMPLGTSLALLLGPWAMLLGSHDNGWRIWWCLLSGVAILMAVLVAWRVPSDRRAHSLEAPTAQGKSATRTLFALTIRSKPVWLMALTFAAYSGQWLAVVGFLPTIYARAGVASTTAAWLTALAAALNMVGNVVAGRLLEKNIPAPVLLATGFLVMGTGTLLAFGTNIGPWWQYAAIIAFSAVGGLIPATLFSLSIRLAPRPEAVSATVGWLQQWSSAGQFAVPPLMAWVAVRSGGWQWTGGVSAAFCVTGLWLAFQIRRELARPRQP